MSLLILLALQTELVKIGRIYNSVRDVTRHMCSAKDFKGGKMNISACTQYVNGSRTAALNTNTFILLATW